MPRKEPENFTTIEIEKNVKKRLEDYKVHPNQRFAEVIKAFLDENEKQLEEIDKKENETNNNN